MSDLRKAAQQALDTWDAEDWFDADNLRAALAQPEPFQPDWDRVKALEASLREHMAEIQRLKAQPEPVAHRIFDGEGSYVFVDGDPSEFEVEWSARYRRKYEPLYTHQPQRNPLADEIEKIIHDNTDSDGICCADDLLTAIRAHGIGEWWPVFQRAAADSEGGEV